MNTTDMHIPSNKVRDIERYIRTELAAFYPDSELRMFTRLLFEAVLGWNQVRLLSSRDETVNQSDLLRFHWAVEDLKHYRPIQHIIGYTDFCSCRIEVDESTLIPRPETEEIVNYTISTLNSPACSAGLRPQWSKLSTLNSQLSTIKVLDLCTGSGCIAIALAKHLPGAEVWAVDISDKALNVAKRNAEANNVNVFFLQSDLLSNSNNSLFANHYSLIISNPPYVMEKERAAMQNNVLDWEPESALFVPDDDPLRFYRAIADIAVQCLKPHGIIVLEINEQLSSETAALMESKGFMVKIHNDFCDKPRMLIATSSAKE